MYIDNDDKLETFFLNNYSLIIWPLIDVTLTPRDPQYDAYDVSQHYRLSGCGALVFKLVLELNELDEKLETHARLHITRLIVARPFFET